VSQPKANEKVVYCQIDAHLDSNPKIRKAGRDARDIFEFLLRRTAIARTEGTVPLAYIDPEYLADQLMMTCDEARHGTSRASQARLIEIDPQGGLVRIVGWSAEWSRQPKNGAERTAAWRAKQAESLGGRDDCDETRHTTSRVTGGDESDAREEKRREDNTEGVASAPPATPGGLEVVRKKVNRSAESRATKIPDRAWKAADYLRECVIADDPSALVSREPWGNEVRSGWRLKWADEIRLMVTQDGRTYDQIAEVLRYVFREQTGDVRFIVQGASALREKFDRIQAVRRNQKPEKTTKPAAIPIAQGSLGGVK
jgi:hypothetical protein